MTFGAMARATDGFSGISVLVPNSDYFKFNLYSWITAPIVSTGFIEGGRLVSFIAGMATIAFTFAIARHLIGVIGAICAAVVLIVTPMFSMFMIHVMPESTSTMLTTASVYLMLKFAQTSHRNYYVGGLLAYGFGIANHSWELSILPVLLFLTARRVSSRERFINWGTLIGVSIVLLFSGSFLWGDPRPGSTVFDHPIIKDFSILGSPGHLFNMQVWWPYGTSPLDALRDDLHAKLYVPTAILATIPLAFMAWRTNNDRSEQMKFSMVLVWMVSGLSLILLFPKGYLIHDYYSWGVLVPLSLAAVIGVRTIGRRFSTPTLSRLFVLGLPFFLTGLIMIEGINNNLVLADHFNQFWITEVEKAEIKGSAAELRTYLDQNSIADSEIVIVPDCRMNKRQVTFILYAQLVPECNRHSEPGPNRVLLENQISDTNTRALTIHMSTQPPTLPDSTVLFSVKPDIFVLKHSESQ